MAPAIEPMQQPLGIDIWAADSCEALELAGLGSVQAPPEESLPSIDDLVLCSPSARNAESMMNKSFSPAAKKPSPAAKAGACSYSPRFSPSPRHNATSSQLGAACTSPGPVRSLSLPPHPCSHGEGVVGSGSPQGLVDDLRLWRMASSPLLGEIALSPRSVQTETCEEVTQTNTEASHEALGTPRQWQWPVAAGPGITLSTRCTLEEQTPRGGSALRKASAPPEWLASLSAEPVIAG